MVLPLDLNPIIDPGPLSPPFGIHRSFGPTTRRVCVGGSHRAAATVLIHTEWRKKRREGGGGQQGAPRDRVSTVQSSTTVAVLIPWEIRSTRSYLTIAPLLFTTILGQAFFLLENLFLILLSRKFCAPLFDRERYLVTKVISI